MVVRKNDFIEIEFTGKISKTNEVFDTNIEADAKAAKLDIKDIKPFILSIGHKMLPLGFENDLEGKEIGKSYTVEIKPEEAFGKRNPAMVRMIPTKLFHAQKINPQRGMQLSLDGQLVKILSSDRGRTLVDFNNPLAGKDIEYTYKINRIVKDIKEKVNALQDFLFRKRFDFDIENKKATFKVKKGQEGFIGIFAPKFKEILGIDIEAKIVASEGVPSKEGKEKASRDVLSEEGKEKKF